MSSALQMSTSATIIINGTAHVIKSGDGRVPVHTSLLEYLRGEAGLKGTKSGCNVGGCGACTVLVSSPPARSYGVLEHKSVNACITPLLALDGCSVTTCEGLGDTKAPHPVQARIAKCHGSQCGFCTPGMTMSLYTHLLNDPTPNAAELEAVFSGNLCRCTGYRPLLDAAKSFAIDIEEVFEAKKRSLAEKYPDNTFKDPMDSTDAGPYPPLSDQGLIRECSDTMEKVRHLKDDAPFDAIRDLKPVALGESIKSCLVFTDSHDNIWLQPRTMEQMREVFGQYPAAHMIAGNTGFGGVLKRRLTAEGAPKFLMFTGHIKELHSISLSDSFELHVGTGITFAALERDLMRLLKASVSIRNDLWTFAALTELLTAVGQIATPQVRNTTTLAGHILSKPSGELVPLLAAMFATVTVTGPKGQIRIPVSEIAGASRGLARGEFLSEISIPPQTNRFVAMGRSKLRRDNTMPSCVLGFSCTVVRRDADVYVKDISIGCTGTSFYYVDLPESANTLDGVSIKDDFQTPLRVAADQMIAVLRNGVHEPPEGKLPYKISVARGLLFRLFSRLQQQLDVQVMNSSLLGSNYAEGRPVTSAVQSWEVTRGGIHDSHHQTIESDVRQPVGDPEMCVTGIQQSTGQAVFVDDIPTPAGCLYAALVLSTEPLATVTSVDTTNAAAVPGFVRYIDHRDAPNKNANRDGKEHSFAQDEVVCVGDVIGVVVAETHVAARRAAGLVKPTYQVEGKPIFSIADAMNSQSFYNYTKEVSNGNVDMIMNDATGSYTNISGVLHEGGQEHFYLEPHALLVCPGEGDDIEVFSMTQCVTKTQKCVADILNIPQSKVTVKVKRIGGAFGGKEVRSTYTAGTLAVAATTLKRPVRWLIDREEDMKITGGRHPYRAEWSAAYSKEEQKIVAFDVQLYSNGGCTDSATSEVMTRSLMHVTNAYHIPHVRVRGHLCRTNISSNTAFRGFGAPQAMLVVENVMEAVAMALRIPIEELQHSHLLPEGGITHYGQRVHYCKLQEMFANLLKSTNFSDRKLQIHAFNAKNRYVKRGIAITPTLYGINFPVKHLNQGGAFVCVYTDGSVQLSHSAVEMGQGINTKCAQVAARALGIQTKHIHVTDSASDKVPNTPPTAASMGSDLTCMAVIDACEQLMARLKPLMDLHKAKTFSQICKMAFESRIPLSAVGAYKTAKGADYDWRLQTEDNAERGPAFNYHVFGVGVSSVELDVITGHFRVLRTDLLMDCGETLNAAVDIGQVEGAFLQGMGWLTMEEVIIGERQISQQSSVDVATARRNGPTPGTVYSSSPHLYKIPGASDVPIDFRCTLLSGAPNPFAVHGSKAVGEPPLFLAASVFFALKQAIYSARRDEQYGDFLPLDSPLTAERIRMACRDEFTTGTYAGVEYTAPGSF